MVSSLQGQEQTGSGVHTAPCRVGTGGRFLEGKAAGA
jgi:hypothetical protein